MRINKYIGKEHGFASRCTIIAIIALIALVFNGFQYINWNPTYAGWTQKIVFFSFFLLFCVRLVKIKGCYFKNYVCLLMFLPFFSMFNSLLIYGQSFYDSSLAMCSSFAWVLYFLLHRYKVSESTVMRVFLYIALFIVVVQIVQQFTYPNAYFGVMSEQDLDVGVYEIAEQRNGLWRFRMHHNAYFTVPILFAAWTWYRKNYDRRLLPLIALMLVSVYLTLTRQVMAACVLAIFFSFFMERKVKMGSMVLVVVLALGLYYSYDLLFSSLTEQTKEETTEDNIRLLASAYFWNESIKNPFTFLFGYGLPANGSAFQAHTEYMTQVLHFFTSDVGFIGKIYESGIIYVITFYVLIYKMFFKMKRVLPTYVRLFVVFTAVMSPMIFPLAHPSYLVIWSLVLYICDLHINHSPLALTTTQNERNNF